MSSEQALGKVGSTRSPGRAMWIGALAGAFAGGFAGVLDGLWSYSAVSQFLDDFVGKLRLLAYLAASYGLAGYAFVAGGAFLVWLLSRHTALGEIARLLRARHEARRQRDPLTALGPLSLSTVGLAGFALVAWRIHALALASLATRKHPPLVIASAMGYAILALVLGIVVAFVAAAPAELALRRLLARRVSWARALSSPKVALGAALGLAALAAAVAAFLARETLELLTLRPAIAALVMLALLGSTVSMARRTARASARWPARWRRALPLAIPILLVVSTVLLGASDSVRKASVQSGLAEPLARVYRAASDWDRDGYSSFLGGNDCGAFDRSVHPGAAEIPDDGIDNNCVGGDVTLQDSNDDARFAAVPATVPSDLNIILITIDTLRADHVGAYGYGRPTTPRLDELAARGSLFENGWAHAPSTRYSIPAILTGRYPLNVRYSEISGQWPGLDLANLTIAETLKDQGLFTGAILNYWYFDAQRNMNQGFDTYDNSNKRLHKAVGSEGPAKTQGSSSKEQTDKALEFLDQNATKRFFLWVHYYDPHFDYETHTGIPNFGSAPADRYDNEIRFTDQHIGRLMDGLKSRGLADKTAIVVTGDHGEGFGEHGITMHGYDLYAAQTKVPLIVYVPGIVPRRVRMPAGHVDLLPTLTNLVGAPATKDMMGRSLLGVMTGEEDADQDRWVFQQLSYENNNEYRGAASKSCHVLYNVSPSTSWELYRLDEDPLEERDRINTPGACKEGKEVLETWYDRSEIPAGAVDALLAGPPTLERALELDFGDDIRLVEAKMPPSVRRGQSFELELTWQAMGRPSPGWKVFAHFEGAGRFMGDHKPVRPFEWWQDGQYIRYRHRVQVPKTTQPGAFRLWLGIFRGDDRMPARSSAGIPISDNRAQVGSIEVKP